MTGGGVDAVGMLRVIAASGYDGPVIVEPFWPTRTRLATMPPDEAAGEVAASLRSLFAAVADRS